MKIIQIMGSDQRVCQAARVSLDKDLDQRSAEDDIKLIRYLVKHRHTSPFEHVRVHFSVPRGSYSMGYLREKLHTECVTAAGSEVLVTCDLHNLLQWLSSPSRMRWWRKLGKRFPASCAPVDATERSVSPVSMQPIALDNGAGSIALVDYMDGGHPDDDRHCVATFRIEVPKFIAIQHMRHRTWSFNEVSRRYTSARLGVWHPSELRAQSVRNLQATEIDAMIVFDHAMGKSVEAYNLLLEMGLTREQARSVLPMGTMTTYYATAPLKWVKHFLGLRLHAGAQPEITTLAEKMRGICEDIFPTQMKGWEP